MTKKIKSAKKEEIKLSTGSLFTDEQQRIREFADKIEAAIEEAEPENGLTQEFIGRVFVLVLSRRAYAQGMQHEQIWKGGN